VSRSPLDVVPSTEAQEYQDATSALHRLMRQGKSFSGRERKCCFLNTGGERFANISAVSGLDFADDGRALASVDWDLDGDLDLWLANRTGPRVRFMRNDTRAGNHFVAVRLEGRSCNRDAIGARVSVFPRGAEDRPLIRTLRAGEGYLSQSSKWLVFGLGATTQVDRVEVRWPGAATQEFQGLEADRWYHLVESLESPQPWQPHERKVQLTPAPVEEPAESDRARCLVVGRLPVAPWSYEDMAGRRETLALSGNRGVLVNLWASWCGPCVKELGEFARRRAEIESAGLRIVALSVDGLGDDDRGDPRRAAELLAEIGFPFAAGRANERLLDSVELLRTSLFYLFRPLPVPTSLLIDGRGRLAAVYEGPVEVEELLRDVAALEVSDEALRDLATPLPGRWHTPTIITPLAEMAGQAFRAGYQDEAIAFYRGALEEGPEPARAADIHFDLGTIFTARNDTRAALAHLGEAVRLRPNDAAAHRGLALALAHDGKTAESRRHYEEAMRHDPADAEAHFELANLLLETAHMAEAADEYREALRLRADHYAAANNLAWILATSRDAALRDGTRAVELAELICQSTKQEDPNWLNTLAAAYAEAGRWEDAVATTRRAIDLFKGRNQTTAVDKATRRLALYESRQPYREP